MKRDRLVANLATISKALVLLQENASKAGDIETEIARVVIEDDLEELLLETKALLDGSVFANEDDYLVRLNTVLEEASFFIDTKSNPGVLSLR